MGYLAGKTSSKLVNVNVHLPLLLATSVLPDIDLLLRFLMHRGPTHSIIIITALMIPFFAFYRKQALPYYAALLSHILIGDFFTGGVQLFWPLSQDWFGTLNLEVTSLASASAELLLLAFALPVMYKLGDLQSLSKPHNRNWVLIIPLGATVGPLLGFGRGTESALPVLLVIPSLSFIGLFVYSMVIDLKASRNKGTGNPRLDIKQVSLSRFSSPSTNPMNYIANDRKNNCCFKNNG